MSDHTNDSLIPTAFLDNVICHWLSSSPQADPVPGNLVLLVVAPSLAGLPAIRCTEHDYAADRQELPHKLARLGNVLHHLRAEHEVKE
jgi:hypothetical protein